jgi:alpha-L-fucosidase
MSITRRQALAAAAAAIPALNLGSAQSQVPPIAPGPFAGTRSSLKEYQVPQWFRDAKFGIWAHWGPQSAPEFGDWYARNMYIEGHRQYKYHLKTYGHPSKFGFKDIIPTWKAEKFDAEYLMDLYHKAGAKYFVGMGVHHDNFDLWNSKFNHWNSVKMGPKKDIVGLFRQAALKRGMRFGVSEHLAVSYHWFQTSHGADKEGPYKGVPYDGANPKFASLYHETHDAPKHSWDQETVPVRWRRHYFDRIKDLLDEYQPDLLYTDGPIFFEEWGLGLTAHLYNLSAKRSNGRVEGVYANKGKSDCTGGTCVLDLERGVVDRIWDEPWQTDTCIGRWHYDKEATYKTPKIVIDMLVDIVSRNGNLLLNFPLPSSGALDAEELKVLDEITRWMGVNSEGIYATRPWKIMGSGPNIEAADQARAGMGAHHQAGAFNERNRKPLSPQDVRYTTKGKTLYAFCMGWPENRTIQIADLGLGGAQQVAKIANVQLLGFKGKLKWSQSDSALNVELPESKPSDHAITLKVEGAIV